MTLLVWLEGRQVAILRSTRSRPLRLEWDAAVIEQLPGAPWLSCSLLVSRRPADARLFFSGLLPEGDHRRQIAELAGVLPNDTVGLLARYGRDVAGAVAVISEDADPPDDHRGDVEPLGEAALDAEVAALPERVLGLHDDSELLLDGMQDKMTLVALPGGGWGRPIRGRPSTHILKTDDPRYPGLVAAEAACLQLGRQVGVTTVEASVQQLGGTDTIIVERFDRTGPRNSPRRIHQEDACQALGRDPLRMYGDRPYGKYQLGGGPSFAEIARLLTTYAVDPAVELRRLVELMVFSVAIGNADAHGKNVGLLHPDPQHITLAPAYDTVPTVLWPRLPTRAAMFVNGTADLPAVTGEDLACEPVRWGVTYEQSRQLVEGMLTRIAEATDGLDHSAVAMATVGRCRELRGSLE